MTEEKTCDTGGLMKVLETLRSIDEPHFDVGGLLGLNRPAYVAVESLHNVVLNHTEPAIAFHWDDDKTLTVKRTDGGVMATFEMTF
jgi:hypothetical protein